MSTTTKSATRPTYEPVPAAQYSAKLLNSEDKKTRSGGRMLSTAFRIDSGEHEGRLLFHNFNYENSSEVATEIGKDQLNKFILAAGGKGLEEDLGGNYGRISDFKDSSVIVKVKVNSPESYVDKSGTPKMSKAGNKITSFMSN